MGVKRLNPVHKARYLKRKSKVGKHEECRVAVKTATDQ